jgi:hypothetical protein
LYCITALSVAFIGDVNAGCAPAFLRNRALMKDYFASIEKLRRDAAEAAMVRDLTTDPVKRDIYSRLHDHFTLLADEVEMAMSRSESTALVGNRQQSIRSETNAKGH